MSLTRSPTLAVAALRPTPFGTRLRRSLNPAAVVFAVAILVLLFIVIAPVARLLVSSFQSTDTHAFTLENYAIAWGHARDLVAVGNSLRYALEVTILSAIFAVPIAWGVSRTDMPAKGLVRALILGAFITPPYLGAIGWILLGGPNAGWLNRVFMALTGSSSGFMSVYSFGGLVLVTALYAFPYIFVFTSAALDLVSTEMEEAANILGAGGVRTIFRITLPLVLPAILGGATIVFLDTVALFGTPAIIALPARIRVMTLVLWQFFEFPVRAEAAAAYSIPLIALTVALIALQRFSTSAAKDTWRSPARVEAAAPHNSVPGAFWSSPTRSSWSRSPSSSPTRHWRRQLSARPGGLASAGGISPSLISAHCSPTTTPARPSSTASPTPPQQPAFPSHSR